MMRRRRILHADKIIQNVVQIFCLLMFLQLKGYCLLSSNPMLLYSTAPDIRVANITKVNKVTAIIKGLQQGSAVDFLYSKSLICWSDQTAELIQCMNYNETHAGEKMRIVSEGVICPTGIAIDWYTDKIYWTDGETNRIEVISVEQRHRKVLFWTDVDLARAIAVVPKHGLMFWTDWGEVPKIERAGLNGDLSTRKVIVKDDIFWPNGITIDYNNDLIYWVDAKLRFIDVIDFQGGNRKRIVNKTVKRGLEYPYALAFFNDKLYWTDWKIWAIHSWDISTNGPIKELIKSEPVAVDIKVYDASRQQMPTKSYPCEENNGGCSHLCLLSPNEPGYSCACPTGVKLKDGSNTTCHDRPQLMLLVAQRTGISRISLDSPDYSPFTLPLKDLKNVISVDYDPKTEYIYWADTKTISRARLDGNEQSVVLHTSGLCDSIAIDPLARNVYWTDPTMDTITVAHLDGSSKKVIIHEELYNPRAIALHPTAGWMFWSDWNERKPKIERANLDGSGRLLLISERLTWPNGIALDTVTNKLYWGDARTHKIEVSNMDGTDRRELHNSDILHIFGLTLLGNSLYWTDMQKRTLDSINKNTGLERQAVVEQMANMMGVKAVRVDETMGWNQCVDHNGGCSHFCFKRPHDYICGCPLGLELGSDRKMCIEPEAFLVYSRKNIIGRISIENENNNAILPLKDLKEISALAVHVADTKLYWSDSKTKTINRCSINGSNMEKILEGMFLVEGLAIDWSAQNLYWTDTVSQRIEVARLDGSSRRALLWQGLKKPKSIVLDPRRGYMYWSELGSKTIKRAGMDGSFPTVLIEQVGKVHSLTIDYERRTLYWASLDPPSIEYAFLNGTGRKVLADNVPMPYAVTLYNDKIFWGDWNTGIVEAARKTNGTDRKTINNQLDYITDLKVYHRGAGSEADNQCGVDNGGCAHLCLPLPGGEYRCACPAHYRLSANNLTCSEPEEFLLFAQKNAIGRVVAASGESSDMFIPLIGLKNVKIINYDPVEKLLYWIDEESHTIRRVPISYSTTSAITDASTVISGLSRVYDMVLDVLGRALYWTCLDKDSINATSIVNNSSVGIILRGENMRPRLLAFHQTKRLLIWTDMGTGTIMRANADGTGAVELARVSNATALTVDQASAVVYWAVNSKIHAVDIDTNNKRIIWQGGWAGGLGAVGESLYFVGGERWLMRVPLHRRDAPASSHQHAARLVALTTVHRISKEHPCWGGRACGGAPGACLAAGACGCGLRCERAPTCDPGQFLCDLSRHPAAHRAHCIPEEWRCDGQLDCPDGSDEGAGCGSCAAGVRCADGACAPALGACPTGAYCVGAPLPDAFQCDKQLCLSPRLLCDGQKHCEDGSDEAPSACYTQKDREVSAFAVCGGVGGAAGGLVAAWAALRRWRRPRPARRTLDHKLRTRAPPVGASTTEASESLCERYPRPTANPPPSPATASGEGGSLLGGVAGGGGTGAGGAGGRRRPYRHYRAMNRPPPPTPATTDAPDSEPEPAARAPPPSPDPLIY